MRYYTTRGKFRGVHPDLARIGVKEIKINCNEEKIEFIFEGKLLKTFLTNIKKTYFFMKMFKEIEETWECPTS